MSTARATRAEQVAALVEEGSSRYGAEIAVVRQRARESEAKLRAARDRVDARVAARVMHLLRSHHADLHAGLQAQARREIEAPHAGRAPGAAVEQGPGLAPVEPEPVGRGDVRPPPPAEAERW